MKYKHLSYSDRQEMENADRAVLESVLDDAQQRFEMWYEQMMRRKARTAY